MQRSEIVHLTPPGPIIGAQLPCPSRQAHFPSTVTEDAPFYNSSIIESFNFEATKESRVVMKNSVFSEIPRFGSGIADFHTRLSGR
jgi:hypothetical protein